MAWYLGDTRSALDLNRRTQAEPDVRADPSRLALLRSHESWYLEEAGESELSQAVAEAAVRMLPTEFPSAERAYSLGTLGARALSRGRINEGRRLIEEAVEVARATGAGWVVTSCLPFLASAYADQGLEAEARRAIDEAESSLGDTMTEDGSDFFAVTTMTPWVRLMLADYRGAVAASRAMMRLTMDRGLDAGGGRWLAAAQADAECRLGDWDAALGTVAMSEPYVPARSPDAVLASVSGRIKAGRGDLHGARLDVERSLELAHSWRIDDEVPLAAAGSHAWLMQGDAAAAAGCARRAVDAWSRSDSGFLRAELAALSAWTASMLAERSGRRGDAGDDLAAFARSVSDALRVPGRCRDGIDPQLDLAAAWLARRDGDDQPGLWARAATELERISYRPFAVAARQGEAEARLRVGDVAGAGAAIRAALAQVDAMGATAPRPALERLARTAGMRLDEHAADEGNDGAIAMDAAASPWGLSARELEVLALVAAGQTNRQIGEALFITDKTASVHVTHILTKLGVSSRTEAAILASRAGVVEADVGPTATHGN